MKILNPTQKALVSLWYSCVWINRCFRGKIVDVKTSNLVVLCGTPVKLLYKKKIPLQKTSAVWLTTRHLIFFLNICGSAFLRHLKLRVKRIKWMTWPLCIVSRSFALNAPKCVKTPASKDAKNLRKFYSGIFLSPQNRVFRNRKASENLTTTQRCIETPWRRAVYTKTICNWLKRFFNWV